MRTARETWEAAKGALQVQITKSNFDIWFKDSTGLSHQGQLFVVGTPNAFVREWLEKHFSSLVTRVLIGILGEEVTVQFQVCTSSERTAPGRAGAASPLLPMVNPRHTFDTFVVGASNRLAFAGAFAAAEGPGRGHNPLYLYGPSGVGKTHIAHAVANYASGSGMRVLCTSSEQFTNGYVSSIREHRTDEFRARFRNTDLLVIDDVQFMIGKLHTQETLFHTLNDLHQANGQVVVTSDRTPASLTSVDSSLWSRLGCGLIAEIAVPDLETRVAILRARAEEQQAVVDNSVLEYIARQCRRNVRELEGALNHLIAQARLLRQAPTLELAQQAVRAFMEGCAPQAMTPAAIVNAVARHYQISPDTLKGRSRDQKVTQARHVAIYLVREKTNCGLEDIGRLLGRDHSTVVRGYQKIVGLISTNAGLRRNVDEILATFSQ